MFFSVREYTKTTQTNQQKIYEQNKYEMHSLIHKYTQNLHIYVNAEYT